MAKIKGKFITKKNSVKKSKVINGKKVIPEESKVSTVNITPSETLEYDSMIDIGTSEGSDSGNEQSSGQEASVHEDCGNDDGFVDKAPKERRLVKSSVKISNANKRKTDESEQKLCANKKSKLNKPNVPGKVKAPTLEEINEMKETRNLFHSNIFRLQINEMLQEVRIKNKYKNYINGFLENFKHFVNDLENMPDKEDVDNLIWLKNSIISPPLNLKFLKVQEPTNFKFQFIKPSVEPFFLGACNTQTLLGPKLQADIGVLMPAKCWQKENYLNLQYDHKRALYLTYLTQKILDSNLIPHLTINHLKFNYYNNNPLKPVLEITPPEEVGKSLSEKLCLRIFIAGEQQSFKLNRFVPWNNNVRSILFGSSDDDAEALQLATPSYNANVLFDLTMHENQKLLHEVFDQHKNFQEGLILIKVWLRQRQLDVGFSGFNAHIVAMFIAFLFKQRILHSNMSSYQVARNVWNQLASSSWNEDNKGISLCNNINTESKQPTLEQFHASYPVVFVDVTGFYNICSNVSVDVYKRVCLSAKLAVDLLNDMKLNSFKYLFLTKMPLYTQVDHILKINQPDAVEQILEMHVSPGDKYNYAGFAYPQLLKVVTSLLQKGLSKRVDFMLPLEQLTTAWNVNESAASEPHHLHLGFILNPEHAYKILDTGPESINEEASKFRAFWGEKAQLRRFQDGSITESVIWEASGSNLCKKRLIVRSIVLYLLQYHFQLEDKDVEYIAGRFDCALELNRDYKVYTFPKILKARIPEDTNAEACAFHVIKAFDDLARKLSDLKELPLEIVSISGISPVLRYCEPQPILPRSTCLDDTLFADHVQYCVIQLGQSGKWPGELGAFRALKTAFYIRIGELLLEKHKLPCKVTYDGLLVLKKGFCFSLEIAHPKEVVLLKKEKTDKGITTYIDCPESIALEKRHYILPKVTGALKALYQSYSSFGPTVMIAKRWLYCQLIDDGIWPDECTELLIAAQYLGSTAKYVTNSPQMGFINFLRLLAHTDWQSELFLLNFNDTMEEADISELEQRFSSERSTFPPLCIATSYDQTHLGKLWSSEQQPNVHVLAKVTLLARQSLEITESTLLSSTVTIIKPNKIFRSPKLGYDLIIQLKPYQVPGSLAFKFGSIFIDYNKTNFRLPLAGSDLLKNSVRKLREAYSDFAAFFYNPCGGREIAVIWKPSAFRVKEFKVNDVNCCSLTADQKRIKAKKEVLIEDFKFILKDFYLRIGSPDFIEKVISTKKAYSKKYTSNFKKPTSTFKKPTSAFKKPTSTFKKPTSTFKKPTSTFKKPSSTFKKPTSTFKKPTSTFKKPSSTFKKATSSFKKANFFL